MEPDGPGIDLAEFAAADPALPVERMQQILRRPGSG
jgi:hypothetical protein